MREPEWRTRSHLMAMRVCTSEDCPCSSHHLRYLLYIGEFVLYTRDLVSGTEAEERGRKMEKVLSHGGIRLEPKVLKNRSPTFFGHSFIFVLNFAI